MNPETGSFTSMDTWQGNLYEPVTLHKYLYANANPVKYKDPSGMFSLPECNIASAIGAELYQNQNVILGMSLLNGIGKSVMTGLCGGDAGDMTVAFLEGMIEGAAMGMLFCAVAAVLATSMLTVMMAHTTASSVVSIVLAIYRVSEGDYLNALVYGAVAVAGIIGVCRWYKVTYQVDYVGEKGSVKFCAKGVKKSVDDIVSDLPDITTSKGGTRNFQSSGGFEQVMKDFEDLGLINVKEIQTNYGAGKIGYLENGIKVIARPGSKSGGATLEIVFSKGKPYKIRY